MKQIAIALIASLFVTTAGAACYGSGSFRSCTDSSGNSYTIQQYGNTTHMQGYNAATGSSWSQDSHRYGNTTQVYGRDADGNSWNNTIQSYPGGSTYQSGTDSNGNFFSRSCNRHGCN